MGVVIDTSVWSAVLRRGSPAPAPVAAALNHILTTEPVELLGLVRMELLSSIASEQFLASLKRELRKYPDIALEVADYEMAADFRTLCRRKGVQGSLADFLLCAAAVRRELEVFALDRDFRHFAKFIPIQLHLPELIGIEDS